MSNKTLDYNADRMCPAYRRIVSDMLCYETVMVFTRAILREAVPEIEEITDYEAASKRCERCPYSKME